MDELPVFSEGYLLRTQLRRARLLVAAITLVATALGGGWYWEHGEAERRVDSRTRADVQQTLTAWGHLQEAVGEQTLTDADLRAARVVPEGPGIRSGLKLFGPPLRPTGVSYTTTRIRQEAGGVVLVEAFAHYSFDGSRQNGGAFFFMFVRDRDVLRLVAEKGDFRDGL